MLRARWWVVLGGVCFLTRPIVAAPVLEEHVDAGAVRINYQVYAAADLDNPRPEPEEFTYLYWLEPTGDAVTLFTFSLWNAQEDDPLIIGLPRPITATGFLPGTGVAPRVASPAAWRFDQIFQPEIGTVLAPGERTATMFVNSPSSPGEIYSLMHPIPPAICFGCELFNAVPGPSDEPAPGDYDGNGTVELADFDGWKGHFGESRPVLLGTRHRYDGNADGIVNSADYTLWRNNYSPPAVASAIPEPSGAALLAAILPLIFDLWQLSRGRRRVDLSA